MSERDDGVLRQDSPADSEDWTHTFRVDLEYDGTDFLGWQRQSTGRTVQGVLEEALQDIFGEPCRTAGAGRTDAGVHAKGQVAGFRVSHSIPPEALMLRLNQLLPQDVAARKACRVSPEFHPRYSAISKTYRFSIHLDPVRSPLASRYAWNIRDRLDIEKMRDGAAVLLGVNDFSSFSRSQTCSQSKVRELQVCQVLASQEAVSIVLTASGFLNRMARMIVGALVQLGRGRMSVDDVAAVLRAQRVGLAGPPAPACGLCLERVEYPAPWDAPSIPSPHRGRG